MQVNFNKTLSVIGRSIGSGFDINSSMHLQWLIKSIFSPCILQFDSTYFLFSLILQQLGIKTKMFSVLQCCGVNPKNSTFGVSAMIYTDHLRRQNILTKHRPKIKRFQYVAIFLEYFYFTLTICYRVWRRKFTIFKTKMSTISII